MVCEFFCNPPIPSKSQCETETETQVETQTRKHVHGPLNDLFWNRKIVFLIILIYPAHCGHDPFR